MEEWLKEITQMEVRITEFNDTGRLAFVYRDKYSFQKLSIDSLELILAQPTIGKFSVEQLERELQKLKEIIGSNVVFYFESASSYQRKMLLKHRMSFIIARNSLFLPALGMYISNHNPTSNKADKDQLSPIAQLVFIYTLLYVNKPTTFTELSKQMNIKKMSVSRAFDELCPKRLFELEVKGKMKFVVYRKSKREILDIAMPYLINPIQKTIYCEMETASTKTRISSTSALSELSLLSEKQTIKAIYSREFSKNTLNFHQYTQNDTVITKYPLELWKYDPSLLSNNEYVDKISLYLSLKNEKDERVLGELDEMWEGFLWSLDSRDSVMNS